MKKVILSLLLFVFGLPGAVFAQDAAKPAAIRLDWATYNFSSEVLRHFGWLEKDLKKDGITVTWLQSTGSSTANQLLASGAVDFNSTAGSAALLARTNGIGLKTVYVYDWPEWEQLIVKQDSPIQTLADLRGKKISATKGTDAEFFLLHVLKQAGFTQDDIQWVNLNHPDGHVAWGRGTVDAWVGLDPFLAEARIHENARVLLSNKDYLTLGTLNVSDDFLAKYPEYVKVVIREYERARKWILKHPDEAAQIFADDVHLGVDVAKEELTRVDFKTHVGVPDAYLHETLSTLVPLLIEQKLVKEGSDPAKALDELVDPTLASEVLGSKHDSSGSAEAVTKAE